MGAVTPSPSSGTLGTVASTRRSLGIQQHPIHMALSKSASPGSWSISGTLRSTSDMIMGTIGGCEPPMTAPVTCIFFKKLNGDATTQGHAHSNLSSSTCEAKGCVAHTSSRGVQPPHPSHTTFNVWSGWVSPVSHSNTGHRKAAE